MSYNYPEKMGGKQKSRHFDKKNAQRFRLVPGGGVPFPPCLVNSTNSQESCNTEEERKAEQVKYGVFFDDDYNYMQHLKSSSEASRIDITSYKIGNTNPTDSPVLLKCKETDVAANEDIGEINTQLDQLDDMSSDCSDGLDDEFVLQANCGNLPSLEEHGLVTKTRLAEPYLDNNFKTELLKRLEHSADVDNQMKEYYERNICQVASAEERVFTDERLEKMLESYDDGDIGALDDEEIHGGQLDPSDDLFKQAEEDFESRRSVNKKPAKSALQLISMEDKSEVEELQSEDDETDDQMSSDSQEYDKVHYSIKTKPSQMLNCESILSLTSTSSYTPQMIVEKSKKPKKIYLSELPQVSKHEEKITQINEDDNSVPNIYFRLPGETADERKARKAEVKEKKRERREQKKVLKGVFKRERDVAERELASSVAAVRLA